MIDLKRFGIERKVVTPFFGGNTVVDGRKFHYNVEDGWYALGIKHKIEWLRTATQLEKEKAIIQNDKIKTYKMYVVGNECVPLNFDSFKRLGFSESTQVSFLSGVFLDEVVVVLWEDNHLYYWKHIPPTNKSLLDGIKLSIANHLQLPDKGLTPELRYCYLIESIRQQDRDALVALEKEALSRIEMQKRIIEFRSTFSGRLADSITKAGGTLIKFSPYQKNYLVEWEIGGQVVKSVIKDTMRVENAGFCLSGDDVRHTITSLVQLARLFQYDDPLYITRE